MHTHFAGNSVFPDGVKTNVVYLHFKLFKILIFKASSLPDRFKILCLEILSSAESKYFQDPEDVSLLADCCKAADNCCSTIQKLNVTKSSSSLASTSDQPATCPATWDGWQCWDPGHPGKNSSKYINHCHHSSPSSFFIIHCHQAYILKANKSADSAFQSQKICGKSE